MQPRIPALKPLLECLRDDVSLRAVPNAEHVPPIAALTARMARGEEQAFREFYDSFFHRLFAYLLVVSRGEEDQAREALQNTLLRIVKNIRRFDDEAAFWSWLTVLGRSALIDEGRKRSRYFGLLARFLRMRPAVPAVTAPEEESRLLSLLDRCLGDLAQEDRDLLERKYFQHASVKEIAAALGYSEKAVDSRLVRLRKKLKETILLGLKYENRT